MNSGCAGRRWIDKQDLGCFADHLKCLSYWAHEFYSPYLSLGPRMIIFDLRIRFILLRAICLSSIVSICELISTWSFWSERRYYYYLSAVLAPVTFTHHFLRCASSKPRSGLICSLARIFCLYSVHSVLVSASPDF